MTIDSPQVRLGLPKGRMNAGILQLLADAGMPAVQTGRDYRPRLRNCAFDVKLLKPQNVVTMLDQGSRDLGFAGADWVGELGAELVELLDLELDPVRIVAAAPDALLVDGRLPQRPLRIATEYAGLTREWIAREGLEASIVLSHGATEAFPPDDADLIVDNTATGTTLQQNGLQIIAELSRSSTRLFANPRSYADPVRRDVIDAFVLLLRSVLAARSRAMLDVNVPADRLQQVIEVLPAMQQPTVSTLHGGDGFAVRAAVRREELPALLPRLRDQGARDLVVTPVSQLVP
ncbi:MAG: ATP phosphoribosyltransferase [Planctomycetota bacterium]